MRKVGVGIVGCGRISPQYLQNLVTMFPYCLEIKGLADMVYALRLGCQPRASEELIYHALDVMHAIHEASDSGQHIMLKSTVERLTPFAPGLMTRIFE